MHSLTDLNFQPSDAAYSLLVGDPLLPEQSARLAHSRVVHLTIDPTVPKADSSAEAADGDDQDECGADGEEQKQSDPDLIVNTRPARPDDGLLSDAEFAQLFDKLPRPVSAYDEGFRSCRSLDVTDRNKDTTFGSRVPVPDDRHGAFEPIWTSYTHVRGCDFFVL